jgi:hypothetical protein
MLAAPSAGPRLSGNLRRSRLNHAERIEDGGQQAFGRVKLYSAGHRLHAALTESDGFGHPLSHPHRILIDLSHALYRSNHQLYSPPSSSESRAVTWEGVSETRGSRPAMLAPPYLSETVFRAKGS